MTIKMIKVKIENGSKFIELQLSEENTKKFIDELKECISKPHEKPFVAINRNIIMGSSFLSNSVITIGV